MINGTDHKYGYLNQEENDELGLGWLTFRHRNYMPEIGRFFGVDPVSSEYMSISTYQFAHNSPIWKIELEGLEGEIPQDVIPGAVDIPNNEPVKVKGTKLPTAAIDYKATMSSVGAIVLTVASLDGPEPGPADVTAAGIAFSAGAGIAMGQLMVDGWNIFANSYNALNAEEAATSEEAAEASSDSSKDEKLELPGLDSTGKVHGELPKVEDLATFGDDELGILAEDLGKSVQARIKATNEKGPSATEQQNKQHGERQAQEQNLIKSIEKALKNRGN